MNRFSRPSRSAPGLALLGGVLVVVLAACTSSIAGSGSAASVVSTSASSSSSGSSETSSSSRESSSSSESSSESSSSSGSTTSRTSSTAPSTFGPDTKVTDLLWGIPPAADDWTIVDEATGYRTYGPVGSCRVTYSQPAGLTDAADDAAQIVQRYTDRALESFAAEQGVTDLPDPQILDTDGTSFDVEPGDGLPDSIDFVGLHATHPFPSTPVTTQAYALRVGEFALVLVTACNQADFDSAYPSTIEPVLLDSTVSIEL